MNLTEATTLLRVVKAICPSQQIDDWTAEAWEMALWDITAADAMAAVRSMARRELEPGKARYIEPGHIRHAVRKLRDDRLTNHPAVEPPPDLSPAAYLEWRRDIVARIADGEIIEQPELDHRAMPQLEGLLKAMPQC